VYTYAVLVATLWTRWSPRPPLERSTSALALEQLSLSTGSLCCGVRGVSRSTVVFFTRFPCVMNVFVFLQNIIIYCAFSDRVNSIGFLFCVEKLTCDWSLLARLEYRANTLRWGLAESFCWPLSLRSPQRVSFILLRLSTVFV